MLTIVTSTDVKLMNDFRYALWKSRTFFEPTSFVRERNFCNFLFGLGIK